MKRVILWGTGYYYELRKEIIKDIIDIGEIEVVAIASRDEYMGERLSIKADYISVNEIKKYSFDMIIITADSEAEKSILKDACSLGIVIDKIVSFSNFVSNIGNTKYQKRVVHNQVNVLKEILSASDKEIENVEWMKAKINEYGIYPFKLGGDNYCEYGVLQVVEEFAEFCIFISKLRIETAIEIGVYRGRSSYFMCAILARKNYDMKYKMVDIWDALDNFSEYQMVLPQLEKCIPNTSDDFKEEEYDFVFIDADHSYDASINDYRNIGANSKVITCFHDIFAHEYDEKNGGTVRMWKEVKEQNQEKIIKEFSIYPNEWMGIGCVVK